MDNHEPMHLGPRFRVALGVGVAATLTSATAALGNGDSVPEPTVAIVLSTWTGDLLPWIGIIVATAGYVAAVLVVNLRHPVTKVPRWRIVAWLAGVASIGVALLSAVDIYADSLFIVHMGQHLLLAMVAPPLLALGAPVTLALRVASPRLRRWVLLPFLHSRVVKAVSWPPVGWTVFAVVMWATHFTALFNAALENETIHSGEHLLFLASGALFWWPVIGADPIRWRLGPIARVVYLAAQMPLNTAVGLAIYFAPAILYPHYASLGMTWGPDPLTDQQLAGIVMWGAGDAILLGAVVIGVEAWLRGDEKRSRRTQERAERNANRASVERG